VAPRFYNNPPSNKDAWWKNAYKNNDKIVPTFEFQSGRDWVRPGQLIRIKGKTGTFKFRCLATNTELDVTWIDCIETKTGHFRAFYIEQFKGIVKPKKSRRKKPIEKI
jgi:hypothetical protein